MNATKISDAIIKAIAEDIILKLEYDKDIDKYIMPEGAIFCIDPKLAQLAATALNVELKPKEQ